MSPGFRPPSIVGRDGTVKGTFVGYDGDATAKEIDAAIDKALAERSPSDSHLVLLEATFLGAGVMTGAA